MFNEVHNDEYDLYENSDMKYYSRNPFGDYTLRESIPKDLDVSDFEFVTRIEQEDYSPNFPEEVWILILSKLQFLNLYRFLTVSKQFHKSIVNKSVLSLPMYEIRELRETSYNDWISLSLTNLILSRFVNLTRLGLPREHLINDEGIKGLINLTKLSLEFNTRISDAGIKNLTTLTKLNISEHQYLNAENYISDFGIMKLTNLRSLNIGFNIRITNEGLFLLTNLTKLNIDYNHQVTIESLKCLPNLTDLSLRYNAKITDSCLLYLPQIKILNLDFNFVITDVGVASLTNLTKLSTNWNTKASNPFKAQRREGFINFKEL
jgi:hypothetical protein